ncbi:MAG TPA: hypothetical protein VII01_08995 [Solirubrobacteraceae bacterium]
MIVPIIILGLVGVVVLVVSAPLRERRSTTAVGERGAPRRENVPAERVELDDLEAEREAKYREIRDSELDYRTGKLSREDYETIDAQLRGEAITILDRLERLGRRASAPPD